MNLLYDPWLRTADHQQLSLLTLFREAGSIPDVYALTPQTQIGLYRFLAAMVQDALRPKSIEDIQQVMEYKNLSFVGRYFDQFHDRFEVFSNFYQGDPLEDKIASIARLPPEASTGDNTTHYYHHYDNEHRYCGPCCAECLLGISTVIYGTGAGNTGGYYASPLGSVMFWVPKGNNILETLAMCLVPGPQAYEDAWWRRNETIKMEKLPQASYMRLLTFTPRRVHLIPAGQGRCTRCGLVHPETAMEMYYAPGQGVMQEAEKNDPWVAYRSNGKALFAHRFVNNQYEQVIDKAIEEGLTLPAIVQNARELGCNRVQILGLSFNKASCKEMFQFTKEL